MTLPPCLHAKLDPQEIAPNAALGPSRSWKESLKAMAKDGRNVSDSAVRQEAPALYGAAVRLYGSFTAARSAAGIKLKK